MDISAQNTFTPALLVRGDDGFDFVVSGTFVATVTLQISDDNSTWIDVDSVTDTSVQAGEMNRTWYVRAGVKSGDYTSGTATVLVR